MDYQDLYCIRLVCIVILATEIVFGSIGNTLSIVVWHTGKKCSKAACAMYLKILTVTDICVLLVPALKFCLDLCNVSLSHLHVILCKAFGFFELFWPQISAWTVVCLSVERMLSLCFPLQFPTRSARKRAYISAGVTVIVMTGLNSFELVNRTMYTYQFNQTLEDGSVVNKSQVFCVTILTAEYEILGTVSYMWILTILPFVLVTICNGAIVVKIFTIRKIQRTTLHRQHNAASFTKICVAIGILYCISTLPLLFHTLNLYRVIEIITINTFTYTAFRMIAYSCLYLNNCLNFLLYCLTGTDFRTDLKELFPCLKNRNRLSTSIISRESGTSVKSSHNTVYKLNQTLPDTDSSVVNLTYFNRRQDQKSN